MKYVKFGDGFVGLADTTTEDTMAAHGEKLYAATNKEVVAWLAAQVPTSVTARQAHEALIRKGLIDNIRNAIAGIPDPVEQALANNWFEKSNSFERSNETLKAVAGGIGLTSGDIDNLFKYASTL